MSTKPLKIRFSVIPAMLFAAGLGLIFHYGDAWYRLPVYSAAEVEQSVELNLALEQQRGNAANTTQLVEQIEPQRQRIRSDLLAEIQRERRDAQAGTGTGIILLLMGLVQMLILRRLSAQ